MWEERTGEARQSAPGASRAVETFTVGLAQGGTAVRAALSTLWSNGQAEGQSTRLRPIKRTVYGRAGLDLLRRRVLFAA